MKKNPKTPLCLTSFYFSTPLFCLFIFLSSQVSVILVPFVTAGLLSPPCIPSTLLVRSPVLYSASPVPHTSCPPTLCSPSTHSDILPVPTPNLPPPFRTPTPCNPRSLRTFESTIRTLLSIPSHHADRSLDFPFFFSSYFSHQKFFNFFSFSVASAKPNHFLHQLGEKCIICKDLENR